MTTKEQEWVPEACTLPTAERPLRLAEFDGLFATALLGQRRLSPAALVWDLDPVHEATARGLAARESDCCSFFSFAFQPGDGVLRLGVEVPDAHIPVLDALQQRATDRVRP